MIAFPGLDEIRAEAETFFEWDTDKRDYVTYTSCLLFAQHCVGKWLSRADKIDNLNKEIQEEIVNLLRKVDLVEAEKDRLRSAIEKTIIENLHLADGDVCTLIDLKRAIGWNVFPNTEDAP